MCPGKQLVDLAVRMAVDDPGEDVGEVGNRVDVVQLAGFDQRRDSGPMLGATVGARKQRIFPVERDRAYRALDGIVVELDAAIVDEVRQALPARQGVADGFGEFALLADKTKFFCCRTVRRSSALRPRMSFSTA